MGTVRVMNYTDRPLLTIGGVAGTCWGSKPSERIAKHCFESEHLRTFEFADITLELDGYSARVIRELYTHIIGTSRLQASTRYIDYSEFAYFIPPSIAGDKQALDLYNNCIKEIRNTMVALLEMGKPKEDVANLLPMSHHTKMVLKINARALLHLAELRLCTRAYHEFRKLLSDIKTAIRGLESQNEDATGWGFIADNMNPKCINAGYCTEAYGCGLRPKKEIVLGGK